MDEVFPDFKPHRQQGLAQATFLAEFGAEWQSFVLGGAFVNGHRISYNPKLRTWYNDALKRPATWEEEKLLYQRMALEWKRKQALQQAAPVTVPPMIQGTRARDILRARLGPNPYPVQAESHHIFGVELFNTPLGQRLRNWGIDLNSPVNGVWLPKRDYPGRVASLHRGRTAGAYTKEVTEKLDAAKSKDEALEILADLKTALQQGSLKINNAK
jgi:hypothetical protein